MTKFVGSDIGGTFTDLVGYDSVSKSLVFGKRLTTSTDLVEAVLSCLNDVNLKITDIDVLKHGSTQVINALLERRGAKTALITTKGFRDSLEIGRAGRPIAFKMNYQRNPPLVSRQFRFELSERIAYDGSIVQPIDHEELELLACKIEEMGIAAIAISFINAYQNTAHEIEAQDFFKKRLPKCYVTTGTDLSRQWFEYERTATAAANAFVGPLTESYLTRFEEKLAQQDFHGKFYIMASNGGVLSTRKAKEQPIALVESGPIGGGVGASAYARAMGLKKVIAFDMGGTTAKCALIEDFRFEVQPTYYVGGYEYGFPIRASVLDIVEVGTGGGSIAYLKDVNSLKVGPRSAGSEPGPACFKRGGKEPTVTDANLALGRISGNAFLGGRLSLDIQAAKDALNRVGGLLGFGEGETDTVAGGILNLADSQMADAIKEITIERGRDPGEFILFVFGGGGPLHGIELARQLNIPRVIVPPEPGNFSALGMLFADARLDESRTLLLSLNDENVASLDKELVGMRELVKSNLLRDFSGSEIIFESFVEMRFKGQRSSLRVPRDDTNGDANTLRTKFFDMYSKRYAYVDARNEVEIISASSTGIALTEHPELSGLHRAGTLPVTEPNYRDVYFIKASKRISTPIYNRFSLSIGFSIEGPAIIEEFGSTTILGIGDSLKIGEYGELDISINLN
jgi:N-methylhydantoinase A